MLPGFRFLFAAIVMCMSVLVFGLGAAALMRAAHEDFATNTSWRAPPEPRFAKQDEVAKPPVLAILSVQSPATEPVAAPGQPDTGAAVSPPPGPDTTAAVGSAAPSPDAAQSDHAAPETSSPASALADNSAPDTPPPAQSEAQPAAPTAPKIAASEDLRPATAATESTTIGKAPPLVDASALPGPQQSPTPVPAAAPATLVLDEAAERIATLGGPPVPIADAAAKPPETKLDRDALNKKLEAERAKERRRLAIHRARLAQQAAAEQAANPFAPHPLIGTPVPVR
jgi:hypothetical protein